MIENIETLKEQLVGLQKKYQKVEEMNHNLNDRLLELYSLYKVSLALSLSFDFDEIMKSFRDLFRKTLNIHQYSIMFLDDSFEILKICSSFGIPKLAASRTSYKFGEDIFGKVVETGQYIYVPNMAANTQFSYHPGNRVQSGSFLSLPLISEDNRPIGVLNLHRKAVNGFNLKELHLLEKIADQIAKVIDKTLLFQQTKELSITDELTGIYNRRYFNQRYEREVMRAIRYQRSLTIVMLDIDHFKVYNDTNGHLLGDEVIKKVSLTIDSIIRKADILARYGGEEFVLILPEITKAKGVQAAEKLRRTIEQTHFQREKTQPCGKLTISLGLATLPDDATDAKTLLEFADKALYMAKKQGRNRVCAYSTVYNFNKTSEIHQIRLKNKTKIKNARTSDFIVANA